MQVTDLAYPGDFTHAKTIRREVAHTISQVQIAVQQGAPVDARFAQFLEDAASKTPGYVGPTLPATQTVIANGATVNVENSAGALDSPATAVVAAGVLTGVNLGATKTIVTDLQSLTVTDASAAPTVNIVAHVATGVASAFTLAAATDCILQNGFAIPVKNFGAVTVPGTHPATVSAGGVTACTLATTVGVVVHGVKQSGWTVTGSGTFFTPTIVAGVCTGGVLSAS